VKFDKLWRKIISAILRCGFLFRDKAVFLDRETISFVIRPNLFHHASSSWWRRDKDTSITRYVIYSKSVVFLFRCRYIVDATLQNYGNIVVSTTFFDNNSLYIKELIAAVAQSVEQWTENPCVISSILIGGKSPAFRGVFFQVRPAGRTSGRGEESLLPPT
jgi:hypothetical protein